MFRSFRRRGPLAILTLLLSVGLTFGQRGMHSGGGSRVGVSAAPASFGSAQAQRGSFVTPPAPTSHLQSHSLVAGHHGSGVSSHRATHYGRFFGHYPYVPAYGGYYYPAYATPGLYFDGYVTGFPDVGGAMGAPAAEVLPSQDDVAVLMVQVPADAELWIEGVKMKMTGSRRRFVSPPLDPALSYAYEVRAAWMENGRKVDQTQTLTVRAGAQSSIAFLAMPADTVSPDASAKRR